MGAKDQIIIEGRKDDLSKLRYDLIPFDSLEELAKVYTFGANKYEDRNWEKGIKYSRIIAALFRHVIAWCKGEIHDPETGIHHLAHAAWNCFAIVHFQKNKFAQFNDMHPVEFGKCRLCDAKIPKGSKYCPSHEEEE